MANHQSLPHHGKPSPALSLMLKEFTERNLRRPWGSLGVALYSTVYGFEVALGWPWGGLGWLCAALFLISAFSFQHFSFCPIVALEWLARPVTNHESRI